jgi:predicted RNase H-like nuclease
MTKLTEKQMIKIIKEGKISKQSREVRDQICAFAFGEKFMQQKEEEKGNLNEYNEVLHD